MSNLWERWEEHYNKGNIDPGQICKDGIIDENKFKVAKPRILFILKDVNDWKSGDLRELCKGGPKYQVWHTLSRWAAGILLRFPEYEKINNRYTMSDALSRIAVINLKKASGGPRAYDSIINAFTFHDRELLLKQINEIKPNLIVSCRVIDPLVWLLQLEINLKELLERPNNLIGIPIYDKKRNAWVIPWKHPGRKNNEATYLELKKIMKQVKISDFQDVI